MNKNKLSHSQANRFMECPKSYEYWYIKKYRSTILNSALLFGSALDHAITSMMNKDKKKPEDTFGHFWRFQDVNSVNTYLPTCTEIVYANSDYDEELLTEEDINKLKDQFKTEEPLEDVKKIYEKKEQYGFINLSKEDKTLLNFANWLCLYRKGLLMLQTVREKILPNIEEVLETQAYIKLENNKGDSVIGYADLICKWKGHKEPIVFDFKTSSRMYEEDSVLTSPQLTLYVHASYEKFQTRKAGFIVLNKNIKKNKTKICVNCKKDGTGQRHKTCDAIINEKRCNGDWIINITFEVMTQILVDEIPEQTENIVLDNFDYINESIHNGVFHRNLGSCVKPYGKCIYYNLCYRGSEEGLIKSEK